MDQGDEIIKLLAELAEEKYSEVKLLKCDVAVPSHRETIETVDLAMSLMFPSFFPCEKLNEKDKLVSFFKGLKRQLSAAYKLSGKTADIEKIACKIISDLPEIKSRLIKDAVAIFEGDPAATSIEEVVLTYPGFFAIAVFRLAHCLYLLGVPYLARIMTEYSHGRTGIDIHPGANIGEYFCIDHGTGIVIGETATIGNRVKLYQGVTLGAKSIEPDESGRVVKGGKRHPDIGNGCIIYAGATILGGDTRIGNNCIIGGNVRITHSIPDGQTVYYDKK